MNILYLTPRIPYPPNSGDRIPSYNALRYLCRRHSVYVATLAESEEELQSAEELRGLGLEIEVVLHPPYRARLAGFRAVITRTPLSLGYYSSGDLRRKITALAKRVRFDVVVAFNSSMGQYAECVPGVPFVVDFVDCDSRKWDLYSTFAQWPRSAIYSLEERRLLDYEKLLARRAACTIVRTDVERVDYLRLIPGARFNVVPNGVDLEHFRPTSEGAHVPNIVFTGIMENFPNVHGARYFCEQIFPLVRSAVPAATFTIVGSRPDSSVRRLSRVEGVAVTGQVPDTRPYLARAAVAVAPLPAARGIQNKILEAMAMAKPVVATRAACSGLDGAEGEGLLAADGPQEFAWQIVRVLKDPALGAEIGSRGRRFVERRYVWEEQLSQLEALLLDVAGFAARPSFSGVEGGTAAAMGPV